jgi:phosphoribosylanthranilate isomerase
MAVKVKICGITNLDDALLAVECGADALGFNFYENSPRYISPQETSQIISKLPPEIDKIGVFVNEHLHEIERACSAGVFDFIQLHGDETSGFVDQLAMRIETRIIKVFRVGNGFVPSTALDYAVHGYLLDADSTRFGGSGESFDWNIAIEFKELVPEFYLAGGLTPDNVADAIKKVRPYAVDVASGVELTKGKKDPKKVEAFIRNAKDAV